jgi:cellulose synthase/poly-beta-1,6-N-acetylglucosamine synthase-like glycosyltransferase
MLNAIIFTLSAAIFCGALIFFPGIHALLLGINFLFQSVLLSCQWFSARARRTPPRLNRRYHENTFVSIHVPAHNEPPDVLMDTLRSLAMLEWANYEVLVIDNNTSDESLWRPVESFCRELGPRFKFFHVEKLAGFKAGAMNHVRRFMDRRTDVILVVDADYQLNRNAIERGLKHFALADVALVQFPQDYRNTGAENVGINLDFKHFFSSYMNMANQLECVPSTGTLSFIRAKALREIGGFDEEVVTEDAELGLRFNLAGYRTVYVHESIGHGLMPFDLESLKKQRWRWAFGNAQILKRNWKGILLSRNLGLSQKIGCLTHLTAWFNFNLLPSLSLILFAVIACFHEVSPLQIYLIVLSGFTLVSFALVKLGIFLIALRRDGHSFSEILRAYGTHLGLGLIFATSWIRCLINDRAPFVRTNKFLVARVPLAFKHTLVEAAFGLALLLSGIGLFATDFLIGPIGATIMGCGRFAIFWVESQMRATRRISEAGLAPAREL